MGLIRVLGALERSSLVRCWRVAFVVVLCFLLSARPGYSQTAAELLRQKATQKKYLLAQIAALRAYGAQLVKGYEIVGDGLETVSGFTRGEWKLHEDYFDSLKIVSPAIKQSKKIVEILKMQVGILQAFSGLGNADLLNPSDLAFIAQVKGDVLNDCEKDLEQLLEVTTSSKLEMSDAERLGRLEVIYASMQEKLVFASDFADQLRLMLRSRKKEQKDIDVLKKSYGID
jgi:hypothetical protein